MPLYDPVTLISDKQSIIIDIGSRYTKFGFSGEACPRCIIPTEVLSNDTGKVRAVFQYQDHDDLRILLVDFIQMLFFKYALVHPKEKRIVIVESLLTPTVIRETLASVFFDHFEVTSLIFVPSHAVTLYTLGIDTGLVLDIGEKEAVLIPVYKGIPVLYGWQALPLGSTAVENNLYDLLGSKIKQVKENGNTEILDASSSTLTRTVLEDIKVKGCFVTTLERAQIIAKGEIPDPEPLGFVYKIAGDKEIHIEPADRELPYEVLFEPNIDQKSLPTMILDSILTCPVDMRKQLAENIVLIGGTVMAAGFKSRFKQEILFHLSTPKYSEKLYFKTVKFHTPPAKENYVAWLGGSICGATDTIIMKSVSREAYLEMNNTVPDWTSLITNKLRTWAV